MKKLFSLFFLVLSLQLMGALTWTTTPTTLSTLGVNASNPSIVMDSSGNLVAVWLEGTSMKASTQPVNGSWTTPVTLVSSGASNPGVVVDPSGNATAIWLAGGLVQAATLPFGGTWSSASTLSAALTTSVTPQIAVDPSGNVVAVWVTAGIVQSATKPFGGTWPLTPTALSVLPAADSPQVAVGPTGVIVAAWHAVSSVSSMDTIYAARGAVGGSWVSAQAISNASQNSVQPSVAVGPGGDAIVGWFTYDISGSNYSNVIFQTASLDGSGFVWETPVNVSNPGIINPAKLVSVLQFDLVGNVAAVWTNSFDGSTYNLESAVLDLLENWSSPQDLAVDTYGYIIDISVTSNGGAYATFMASSGSDVTIQTSESQVGGAIQQDWINTTMISTASGNINPTNTAASTSSNDYAAVIWIAYNGANTVVQVATGQGAKISPPSGLSVVQSSNNYGVFTEYYNTFSWSPSTDPLTIGYVVYRNGILLNQTDSMTFSLVDNNAVQNGSVVYGVASLRQDGEQSGTATINFP